MTTNHTQGRLFVPTMPGTKQVTIWTENGDVKIADCDSKATSLEGNRQNARRIAVCWNVCEGIPTDALEEIAKVFDLNQIIRELASGINSSKKE